MRMADVFFMIYTYYLRIFIVISSSQTELYKLADGRPHETISPTGGYLPQSLIKGKPMVMGCPIFR